MPSVKESSSLSGEEMEIIRIIFSEDIFVTEKYVPRRFRPPQPKAKPKKRRYPVSFRGPKIRKCFECGSEDHIKNACPQLAQRSLVDSPVSGKRTKPTKCNELAICPVCQVQGHVRRMCPTRFHREIESISSAEKGSSETSPSASITSSS